MNKEILSKAINGIKEQYIEEAFSYKIKRRKIKIIKWGALAACLCLIIIVVGQVISKKPKNSDAPTLIVAEDLYTLDNTSIPTKSEQYISPLLQEKMEQYKKDNVLFGVVVEILKTQEDYDECIFSNTLYELEKRRETAIQAYNDALNKLKGVQDEQKRIEITKEIQQKEAIKKALVDEYTTLQRTEIDAHLQRVQDERIKVLNNISGKEAVYMQNASSGYDAYYIELSYDMIYSLADIGGYSFRLSSTDTLFAEDNC